MALAILELLDFNDKFVRFRIDTGTNKYYQLKIGRSIRRRNGINWVDGVVLNTPVTVNESGGGLLNTSKEISIRAPRFDSGDAYVQMFSFKTRDGKSPAFSRVVKVGMGFRFPAPEPDVELPFALATSIDMMHSFQTPRSIPCQTYKETYSQQASLDELLSKLVKIAAPAVLNLLTKPSAATQNGGATAFPGADVVATLLKGILAGIEGASGPVQSKQQSLFTDEVASNRFLVAANQGLSRPFIFGIDDALIASLAGPVLQVLPQLVNAANQKRLQMKQENTKLITGILGTVNQRMLMEKLLEAQRLAAADAQTAKAVELEQLIKLLQVQAEANATNPPPTAQTQSLWPVSDHAATLSAKAVLSFETGAPVQWNGKPTVLFVKGQPIQLKVKFIVAEPAPKAPLPKAILKLVFKDSANQAVLFEKVFKQKSVPANTNLIASFTPGEISQLPVNKALAVLAEMRWLSTKTGKEIKALGSTDISVVNSFFLREQGQSQVVEQELTDMTRFRPFWNKIWEAPSLDRTRQNGDAKKTLWELDVNAKYSVLLSTSQEANGLMNTKLLQARREEESLTDKTEGRMKAGIELSVSELNKLLPLWHGEAVLEPEKLEAFKTEEFARRNAGEFVSHLRLKGRARERGMIWVIPIFKLTEFTLSSVQKLNDDGQVTAVAEEKVRFPLPVSARVIGLKSV